MNSKVLGIILGVNVLSTIVLVAIVIAKLINEDFRAQQASGLFLASQMILIVLLTVTSVLAILSGVRRK